MKPFNVDKNTWNGGYYEAAMILGRCRDPLAANRLHNAISEIWSQPYLSKCVRDLYPGSLDIIRPSSARSLEHVERLYGDLNNNILGNLPFTTIAVRETELENGYDWLYAAVPLGGLPQDDQVHSRSWREPLERCLAQLVIAVSRKVPFEIAQIGFEVATTVGSIDEVIKNASMRKRSFSYVVPDDTGIFRYLPTNQWHKRDVCQAVN